MSKEYTSNITVTWSINNHEFETLCEEENIKDIVPNIDDAIDIIATRWANGSRA